MMIVLSDAAPDGFYSVHHSGAAEFVSWALSVPDRFILVGDQGQRSEFLSAHQLVPPARVITPVEVPAVRKYSPSASSVELAVLDPFRALVGALAVSPVVHTQGGMPLVDDSGTCYRCGSNNEDETTYCAYCDYLMHSRELGDPLDPEDWEEEFQ